MLDELRNANKEAQLSINRRAAEINAPTVACSEIWQPRQRNLAEGWHLDDLPPTSSLLVTPDGREHGMGFEESTEGLRVAQNAKRLPAV